jgi:hypothetical protein
MKIDNIYDITQILSTTYPHRTTRPLLIATDFGSRGRSVPKLYLATIKFCSVTAP